MPNVNRPNGLSPIRHVSSAPYNNGGNIYSIAAAYATALYVGDPVISSGTSNAAGIPGIVLAAATGSIRGVIMGIGKDPNLYQTPGSDITYRPGAAQTTDYFALVCDDPEALFEVQEIGTGTPLTAAEVGLNTNFVAGAGNGFVSGWTLDNATEAVTATLQAKIMWKIQRFDNDIGQYCRWAVKINNHELSGSTAGI